MLMANRHSEKRADGRVPVRKAAKGGGLPDVGEAERLIIDRGRAQNTYRSRHTPDLARDTLWHPCEDPGIERLGRIRAYAERRDIRGHRVTRALDDLLKDARNIFRLGKCGVRDRDR